MIRSLILSLALTLVCAPAVNASEPKPSGGEPPSAPTSFGADEPKPLPVVAPGDFEGLLRNCDLERARAVNAQKMCEKDKVNIPFLTGAYLALWAILMVFFAIVALRQKRMKAEMAALRERLARLGGETS